MDNTTMLHLVLNTAEIPLKIDSTDERLQLQKTIYLIQAAGLNLGYTYSWYKKGPYSPSLTKDYYAAKEDSDRCQEEAQRFVLTIPAQRAVKRASTMIESRPDEVSPVHWIEALASVHYAETNYPPGHFNKTLEEEKPHLTKIFPDARKVLVKQGLIRA